MAIHDVTVEPGDTPPARRSQVEITAERMAPDRHRGARADRLDDRHPALFERVARPCDGTHGVGRGGIVRSDRGEAQRAPHGCGGAAPRRAPGRTRTRSRRVEGLDPRQCRTRCRWRIARSAAPSTAARRPRGTSASGRRPTRARSASARGLRHVSVPAYRSSAIAGVRSSSMASMRSSRARARNVDACWFAVTVPVIVPFTCSSSLGHRHRARRPVGAGDGWNGSEMRERRQRVRTMS